MQFLFQSLWKLILFIPAPGQAAIVLLLLAVVIPWLLLRVIPWILAKITQISVLLSTLTAELISSVECQITNALREKNRQPWSVLYGISGFLAAIVRIFQKFSAQASYLKANAFQKPWILKSKAFYILLPLLFALAWVVRPLLGTSGIATSIDKLFTSWCTLEHAAMTGGDWRPSELTCAYPKSPSRWRHITKAKEYELKADTRQYKKELETNKNNPSLYILRGDAYFSLENLEAALADYNQSLAVMSDYPPGYVGRGDVSFAKTDYNGALKEYLTAIKIDKKYAPAYVGLGNAYLTLNNTKDAFTAFSTAKDINSSYALAYVGRGRAYQKDGDAEASLEQYEKAISLDENCTMAYVSLGSLYEKVLSNREAAIREYEKGAAVALSNGHITTYHKVLSTLEDLNNYTIYTVKNNDSLSKIAKNLGISMPVIVSANKETYPTLVTNPDKIEPGWKLKIPE